MAAIRDYTSFEKLYYKLSSGTIKDFVPKKTPNPEGTQQKGLNTTNIDVIWKDADSILTEIHSNKSYSANNSLITFTMPNYYDSYIGFRMDFGGYGTKVQYYFKLKFEGTDFLSLDEAHTQGLISDVCLTCSNNHTSFPISNTDNWYSGTAIGLSGYPTHRALFKPKAKLLEIQYKYYCSSIWSGGTSSNDGVYIYTTNIKDISTTGIFEDEDIKDDNDEENIQEIVKFSYTGSAQTFAAPEDGTYKIECWGAYCNDRNNWISTTNRACGGYTCGEIELSKGETLYVYVGASGQSFNFGTQSYSKSAGGSTDIRLTGGNWNDTTSLRSRIMVAGGAGGRGGLNSWNSGTPYGGSGGGLTGHQGGSINTGSGGAGGTQTTGYGFGIAGGSNPGGNGYYSGQSGYYSNGVAGGGGGSSFISGHTGCNAIDSNGTHTGQPNHFSGKVFTNTSIIDGNSLMPLPNGQEANGYEGDGCCKITLINKSDVSNIKCKINNEYKEALQVKCKIHNEWRDASCIYLKKDNTWIKASNITTPVVQLIPVMSSNTCDDGTITAGYAGGATYSNSLRIGYPWYVTQPEGKVNNVAYSIRYMAFTNASSINQSHAWWQYNFTDAVTIQKLEGLISRWAESNKITSDSYDVFISTDGSSFTKHGTWTTAITWKESNGNGTGIIPTTYEFETPIKIKAFKLVALNYSSDTWPSTTYFAMYKIQAFGYK